MTWGFFPLNDAAFPAIHLVSRCGAAGGTYPDAYLRKPRWQPTHPKCLGAWLRPTSRHNDERPRGTPVPLREGAHQKGILMVSDVATMPPGVLVTPVLIVILIVFGRIRRLRIAIDLTNHP